ncbi:MAG: L-lactate dehydrogenase [Anaerolineaceae bacterium]|nr:L-lactate dehydrogenase [Anaerolineaceae bacterium]
MKIGIVGSGFVGSTAAYALVMRGIGREIVLIDQDEKRASAEADDIFHAVPFAHSLNVHAGSYSDLVGAKVVIMAAGVNQKPGETRMQLLERNAAVFNSVIPNILRHVPDAIIVVATNPVDVMTHYTAQIAAKHGIPSGRILGSGTTLDTARFRALLSRHLGVDPQQVHAYVVGEHGDSEVLLWSLVNVGGVPVHDFLTARGINITDQDKASIDEKVRRAAYHIIEGKKATYYGVGAALARICEIILNNQRAILTICASHREVVGVKDVTIALPHLISGEGVIGSLPLTLADEETALLAKSARIVRSAIELLP